MCDFYCRYGFCKSKNVPNFECMKKEIYLVGGPEAGSYDDFKDSILALARQLAAGEQVARLWVTLTESPPPKVSVIPFKKGKVAAISLFRDSDEELKAITGMERFRGAYRVEEALPVAYEKTWPNGSATPGVCLLTLFHQRPGINYQSFSHRWFNSHTPMSLKFHPLWHYNRNVVIETLSATEPPFRGIVEEHFRERCDLLNPFRFFGNPLVIIQRMIAVYRDTRSFIDYRTIEPWLVREYHLK